MLRIMRSWIRDEKAAAAIEAGILFPLLVMIMCGTIDVGMGCLINQKAVNATQMISDLMTRGASVSTADINDAVIAGQMAFAPFSVTTYGSDIASIQFLTTALTPTVQWRATQNMLPNNAILGKVVGLGLQDEGVIAVTINYTYHPMFTGYMVDPIVMREESYARSRKGTFVQKVG